MTEPGVRQPEETGVASSAPGVPGGHHGIAFYITAAGRRTRLELRDSDHNIPGRTSSPGGRPRLYMAKAPPAR
ncbi:hypothetical protein KRM28CT15_03290 [Krasilnikovia sp. M28-CT-15]